MFIAGLCVFVEQPGAVYGIVGKPLDIPCLTNTDFTLAFWGVLNGSRYITIWSLTGEGDGFVGDSGARYELVGDGDRDITIRIKSVALDQQQQLSCEVYTDSLHTSDASEITIVGES